MKARHHTLLHKAITAHRGYTFQTIGDEEHAAFEMAQDALAAAMTAQIALHTEDWGVIGSLKVRMGLHTGPATLNGEEYEGYLILSHTKRLMSVAYGGQILLSEATETLLRETIPPEVKMLDLGGHRLKDFERVEHIYQVVWPDLPAEFPPIRSLVSIPNNLPVQLTGFIGRTREINDIKLLLSKERLLTLTGAGGSGKTRLALQVAAEIIDQFQDGVFFVPLAPIFDPVHLYSTIGQGLGLAEIPGRSIGDHLKDYLKNKSILLLLDNFEQVISAAPVVAELLIACANLKIMVTSREKLRIRGESEYPVPPLALPDRKDLASHDSLQQFSAIALFVQRAQAIKPDFQMAEENIPVIAEICDRLDGLPLAIELAAARIKLLSPQAMLARLEHRLDFLTSGPRDLPARQQTLRNAFNWSYALLSENEQALFRRLSVFVGGGSVDAVKAVTDEHPDHPSVSDRLESLVDKSLLQEVGDTGQESRFAMLDTLREFGLEQLAATGEEDIVRRRHAEYYLSLAEQAGGELESIGQVQWLTRMEQEHDNLRAALEWSQSVPGAVEICVRLACSLGLFWEVRGHISEGRERLSVILEAGLARENTPGRAKILTRAAELAYRQSDYPATKSFAEEGLSIYRKMKDEPGMASILIKLGNTATEVGDHLAASAYLEEALNIWQRLGDKPGTARALISLGWNALRSGDYPVAKGHLEEAFTLSKNLGDTRRMGFELAGLGEVALRQGQFKRATQLVEESLRLRRQLDNKWGIAVSLGILGLIAIREGDWKAAEARLAEKSWPSHEDWRPNRLRLVPRALSRSEDGARTGRESH